MESPFYKEIWKFKTGKTKQNGFFEKVGDFKNLELLTQTSDCLQFFVAPEIYSSLWENCLEMIKRSHFFVIENFSQVGTVSSGTRRPPTHRARVVARMR